MSNTDSFIEEVTEEVQRDKLFALLRRWGWVAGLAVLLLVGGAAFNEWRKANQAAKAQAFGDAVLEKLDGSYASTGLSSLVADTPAQAALAGHFAAAQALSEGERISGLAELEKVQDNTEADPIYRELASLKTALALDPSTDVSERLAAFDAITGPFRIIAQEQKALVLISDGQIDAALEILRRLTLSAEATQPMQNRAAQLILALGGEIGHSSDTEATE